MADLSVQQVLSMMVDAYRRSDTYNDEGTVQTEIATPQHGWVDTCWFKTFFVRPDKFRFEVRYKILPDGAGTDHFSVVSSDGCDIRAWDSLSSKTTAYNTTDEALATAIPSSRGAAIVVPSLLLDLSFGVPFLKLHRPRIAGMEDVGGVLCYKIEDLDEMQKTVITWVEQATFLIRKISDHRPDSGFDVRQVMTITPLGRKSTPRSLSAPLDGGG